MKEYEHTFVQKPQMFDLMHAIEVLACCKWELVSVVHTDSCWTAFLKREKVSTNTPIHAKD